MLLLLMVMNDNNEDDDYYIMHGITFDSNDNNWSKNYEDYNNSIIKHSSNIKYNDDNNK